MGLIPDDIVREVREQADIATIIGRHVALKQAGRNLKGLCPFHQEKTPSFSVNPQRGFYYCFGCQAKGDVFNFVMQIEGKSFVEAVRDLAEQYSIVIPESHSHGVDKSRRQELIEATTAAQAYFAREMKKGDAAREYLAGRDIDDGSIDKFQLGYAPPGWRGLTDYLASAGIPRKDAIDAGLIIQREGKTGVYDRFRNRVMCPIFSQSGDVLGFSGRALSSEDKAKYINSPESDLYKKSSLLYGLLQAASDIRMDKSVILVEGNFDVVSLSQRGFTNVVAPLGTALTEKQIGRLSRLAETVILCYDGDKAGLKACHKSIASLLAANVHCRVVILPDGSDPDTMARRHTDELREMVTRAKPAIEYLIHEVWLKRAGSPGEKADTLERAARYLSTLSNPTQRAMALENLSQAFGVSENVIRAAISSRPRPRPEPDQRSAAPQPKLPKPNEFEVNLVAFLTDHPALAQAAEAKKAGELITDARLKSLYQAIIAGDSVVSAVTDELPSASIKKVISGSFLGVEKPEETLSSILHALQSTSIRQQLAELDAQMQRAQRDGNRELQHKLFRQIRSLRNQQVDKNGSKEN